MLPVLSRERTGISPLIAAVLLIAFTMAVAAILTAWVTTFTQQQTGALGNESQEQIKCTFANLEIVASNFESDFVIVAVRNSGKRDLTNVSVAVSDNSGFVLDVLSGDQYFDPLPKAATESTNLTVSGTPHSVRVSSQNCPRLSFTAQR